MSLNNPVISEGYVPAYQMSAIPFVTSSTIAGNATVEISFPQVTRFITVKNVHATNSIYVSFTQNGLLPANSNFITLGVSGTLSEELRTTKLFLKNAAGTTTSYELIAGLTSIPASQFLTITGSNGHASVG